MVRHAHHEGLPRLGHTFPFALSMSKGALFCASPAFLKMMADFRKNLSVPRFSS